MATAFNSRRNASPDVVIHAALAVAVHRVRVISNEPHLSAHNLDFRLQPDAARLKHPCLHLFDQRNQLLRRGATAVDHKARVLGGTLAPPMRSP